MSKANRTSIMDKVRALEAQRDRHHAQVRALDLEITALRRRDVDERLRRFRLADPNGVKSGHS